MADTTPKAESNDTAGKDDAATTTGSTETSSETASETASETGSDTNTADPKDTSGSNKTADTSTDHSADKPADKPGSVSDLADLKDIASDAPASDASTAQNVVVEAMPLREQEIDDAGRAYATGRRKDATARVWLKPGSGKITVNGKDQETYFARPTLRLVINQPFTVTDREGQYDIIATVSGGGLSGQAGAVKHGISQALTRYEPALRSAVKAEGFLTRDSRVVERKKYGRAKARRSFQFSKR